MQHAIESIDFIPTAFVHADNQQMGFEHLFQLMGNFQICRNKIDIAMINDNTGEQAVVLSLIRCYLAGIELVQFQRRDPIVNILIRITGG